MKRKWSKIYAAVNEEKEVGLYTGLWKGSTGTGATVFIVKNIGNGRKQVFMLSLCSVPHSTSKTKFRFCLHSQRIE